MRWMCCREWISCRHRQRLFTARLEKWNRSSVIYSEHIGNLCQLWNDLLDKHINIPPLYDSDLRQNKRDSCKVGKWIEPLINIFRLLSSLRYYYRVHFTIMSSCMHVNGKESPRHPITRSHSTRSATQSLLLLLDSLRALVYHKMKQKK